LGVGEALRTGVALLGAGQGFGAARLEQELVSEVEQLLSTVAGRGRGRCRAAQLGGRDEGAGNLVRGRARVTVRVRVRVGVRVRVRVRVMVRVRVRVRIRVRVRVRVRGRALGGVPRTWRRRTASWLGRGRGRRRRGYPSSSAASRPRPTWG
jgi:hypothetical protein